MLTLDHVLIGKICGSLISAYLREEARASLMEEKVVERFTLNVCLSL